MTPSFTRADVEAAFDRARSHSERLLDFVEFENFLMDLAVQRYPKEGKAVATWGSPHDYRRTPLLLAAVQSLGSPLRGSC